jgi:pimeloyl-ACP methyl ester carboxylesterase
VTDEARRFFPALRRALGLTRFALFGHSVGGAMALAIAAAEDERCVAVVTEAAQAFVEARTLEGIRAVRAEFDRPEQFAKLTRWHGAKARWVLDAWAEVWLSAEFQSWSLDEQLAAVRCPVLAIHGDRDEYGTAAFPRRIVAGVSGPSELAILEGCGHVPHRERRADVLRLVASFLGPALRGRDA